MEITVGYAAGIIALALFIVQLWCPTILTFILAAVLRDKETAATWSVAARSVLSSHWPFLLRSESSSRSNVRTAVYLASISYPAITIITAAAGVVTPLGLYDVVSPSRSMETHQFSYAPDPSAIGLATGPRLNHTFTRTCGYFLPKTCPGQNDTSIIVSEGRNGSGHYPFGLRSQVSDDMIELFSSGTKGARTTVSNFFDIEWRQLTWYTDTSGEANDPVYDNGTARSAGRFQQIDTLVLKDEYNVVEGLIVDGKAGGVGFRNHTIPAGLPLGAEWTEDILFIEPQTECVNNNLTIEFTLTSQYRGNSTSSQQTGYRDLVLIDGGGFSQLNRTYPEHNYNPENSQNDPELRNRAYKAAWLTNFYTALVYNVTNSAYNPNYTRSWAHMTSSLNKKFPLLTSDDADELTRLYISDQMGSFLSRGDLNKKDVFPNPEGIASTNYSDINMVCEGTGGRDLASYTNIYTGCLQMRGVPVRVDGGYEGTFEAGSRWSAPIHTCATAMKASIKTVRFQTTGPGTNLSVLTVTEVVPKRYSSPDKFPIWGIENTKELIRDVVPIWGIISKAYENLPSIKALKQPSIYLPGFRADLSSSMNSMSMYVNLPARQFPVAALQAVSAASGGSSTSLVTLADYSGAGSMSMLRRWRELSKNAETAGQIINLIWTDISTSAVAGSKGVLGHRNMGSPEGGEQVDVKVRPVKRKVRYNLAFAVPALILAAIALFVSVVAGVIACFKGGRVSDVRRVLRQSSTGRLVTALAGPPGDSDLKMGSREWSARNGGKEVDLGVLVPLMVGKDNNSGWTKQEWEGNGYKEQSAVDAVVIPQQQVYDEETGYVYNGGQNQGYQGYAAVSSVGTTTASATPDPPPSGTQNQAQGLQWVVYQGEPYLYYPHQEQGR